MKFKSLFFSLCLLFIGASAFAGTPDMIFDGDDPLTLEAANEKVKLAIAELPVGAVESMSITSIAVDEASCTVSGSLGIPGTNLSVSATAETCGEALDMVLELLDRF